jgi:hypothetical protein
MRHEHARRTGNATAVASASARPSARAGGGRHPLLQLQSTAGNSAVQRLMTVSRVPRLRTAQDSRLRLTAGTGLGEWNVHLEADGAQHAIGSVRVLGCTETTQMPFHLEDFVDTATNRAWVVFTFSPTLARVRVAADEVLAGALTVRVERRPVATSDLEVAAATVPRHDRSAAGETVRGHLGSSEVDSVLASVVSAEGGFGTTQTYDRAVLTWGQGQWTAHSGTLQRALRYIIDRRPDLWDQYFQGQQLDVETGANPRFVHQGAAVATTVAALSQVFRPDDATSQRWVTLFSQFGLDPQVQRLQREYLRGEVRHELARQHGGNAPGDWLTTRAKALFFSMKVNLPATAYQTFRDSVAAGSGGHAGTPVPADVQAAVSAELEDRFRTSGVRAFQNVRGRRVADNVAVDIPRHHTIGFWGETGRNTAIADCDAAIADFAAAAVRTVQVGGVDVRDPWNQARWTNHRQAMVDRESRYQKSSGDIAGALARTDIEPDVPAELLTPPAPAPAPAP